MPILNGERLLEYRCLEVRGVYKLSLKKGESIGEGRLKERASFFEKILVFILQVLFRVP